MMSIAEAMAASMRAAREEQVRDLPRPDGAGTAVPGAPSRRGFLRAAGLTGGGLVLGLAGFGPQGGLLVTAEAAEAARTPFEAYVRIAPDGTVTVLSAQCDKGQGVYTGLATLVAEELDADWAHMRVEGAADDVKLYGNPAFGGALQGTGGSTSMRAFFEIYRKAGATARAMLVAAAAQAWQVDPAQVRVSEGRISHGDRSAGFGEFATAAARMPVPADVALKAPADWKLIGNPGLRRLDAVPKSTGQQMFTIDVKLPGMLTALMIHPPLFGARVASFDAVRAKSMPGVVDVVQVPRGVAVVARDMWSALKAREAVQVSWDESEAETRGTAELMAEYRQAARTGQPAVARDDGDVGAAFAKATADGDAIIEAAFEFPYLAHAPLEPMNAVARFENGRLELWSGHQFPTVDRAVAAGIMGIPEEQVTLHVMMAGGSFGRRAVPDSDFVFDTVSILKATGAKAPIRMQWTRDNDMRAGRYRPMYYHVLKGAVAKDGTVTAWQQRIVGQSILAGTMMARAMVKNGVDQTSVEGAATLPYKVPNLRVDLVTTEAKTPVLWWRSVGSTHTAYSTEMFVDELAQAAGKDPLEFRRTLLGDDKRYLGVLELVAEKAGWGTPAAPGIFRGIAIHESFKTVVGQVVEVSLERDGNVKVERVVCAVDCGLPINPDVVHAQMEGGIGFALSAILKNEVVMEKGRVVAGNFDGYPLLTIEEMPKVEVFIVPSEAPPTGVGEPGVPPLGPALANAVFAATGKRIRILPFSRNDLHSA